ncbi:MAG: activase [Chitinivibrionales bacterium]|nr:activase [Chitinivibrionales bacterium]
MKKAKSLGICLGASNIKAVELIEENEKPCMGNTWVKGHESNPRQAFSDLLKEMDISRYDYVSITGRKFRDIVDVSSITEPEAVEYGLQFLTLSTGKQEPYTAVASLGAENFVIYILDKEGNIATVETGNKCASGTGEFFLQQIRRMNIGPDKAVELARDSEEYRVSGRCSVFCKSDCTHALNKGVPIGRVTAGLCRMMSEKIMDLLEKLPEKRVLVIGGVTHNSVVMNYLRDRVDSLSVPNEAGVFEALGAAWYAMQNKSKTEIDPDNVFKEEKTSFSFLPPISEGERLVEFKDVPEGTARDGDECIVGLDVGSTTTKAVLLRITDNAMLASDYLRTNGNPVQASRQCYESLARQISANISLVGLSVTGSGRQIAGLHASTDAIINEIIAHATGAAYFDSEVDTIFEIGGQDAKYTFLTNAVPSDYAMNEACSAGTGSFLEESARESLGIDYREIANVAVTGKAPPNFNDQCAAFISSDIKTATHEGIEKDDIVAGLVYSICMNYVNRVKGQRRTGEKIFMQGGVCYNRAVPLAMANLIGRKIIVPPNPGLIGAFGVALELKNRLESGLAQKQHFDLQELAAREIEYGKTFVCKGGKEKCDRGCEISMMIINGKKFPFGGACNRYYNLVHHIKYDASEYDHIKKRQALIFDHPTSPENNSTGKKVGISRSYLTNSFFPMFSSFFTRLGYEIVVSDDVDPDGIKLKRSSFCYPGEIAHGCFSNLIKKDLDYIFIPRILELYVDNSVSYKKEHQCTCVLLQSEAYWLKTAFKDIPFSAKLLTPVLNFSKGYESEEHVFGNLARFLGHSAKEGIDAFRYAVAQQQKVARQTKEAGAALLEQLDKKDDEIAIVLFGRPYNAFAREANLAIPTKFASRGIHIIPWDFLPFEKEYCDENMCWAMGQNLWKATEYVKKHPRLFGAFITNFSCGPDSFLLSYFREIMGRKPSLTLELDSHTADAGVDTRIEAFLDIVDRYRHLGEIETAKKAFKPAVVQQENNQPWYVTSEGERVSIYDRRVHLVLPSMGALTTELLAAAFRGAGIKTTALPVYSFDVLKLGRAHSSCKECLPLQLTAGGLLNYLKNRTKKDELLIYFMPTTGGNCRFTQYSVFLKLLIEKHRMRNVALLSLTTENSYAGLPIKSALNVLKGIIVSDVMEDIKNALAVLALDKKRGLEIFDAEWKSICDEFEKNGAGNLYAVLKKSAGRLAGVPLKYPLSQAKKVAMMGEIFVRRDYFACRDLIDRLEKREIIVKRAHIFEWLRYIDYMVKYNVYDPEFDLKSNIEFYAKRFLQRGYEKKIKKILAKSMLYEYEPVEMKKILKYGEQFFDLRFTGESIIVAGAFFKDMLHTVQGTVSVGPFACMPTRVIESILSAESTLVTKQRLDNAMGNGHHSKTYHSVMELPFLSVESDGNPFPQIVEARIEAFSLQVERMHAKLGMVTETAAR